MIHAGILQPKIVIGQQLTVVAPRRSITTMSCEDIKLEFANRMNDVCDLLGIPPKGKNRQQSLGKMFKVSQEAARKWLAGESLPKQSQCIEIAIAAKVSYEWLMTGRGEKTIDAYAVADAAASKDAIKYLSLTPEKKYQVDALIDAMNNNPGNDEDGGNHKHDHGKRPITN